MLGKLIKYEWKSVYKIGCVLLLTIFAVTLLGSIMMRMPFVTDVFAATNGNGYASDQQAFITLFGMTVSFVLYVLLLVGAIYGITIYLGVHFYKTMYTDEGYLTHTLPVTPHQILISKILVGGLWQIIINVTMILSVAVLVTVFGGTIFQSTHTDMSIFEVWEQIGEGFMELNYLLGSGAFRHYIIGMILLLLTTPFTGLMTMFGAFTLGQTSSKHKVMMGILCYVGLLFITNILKAMVQMLIAFAVQDIDGNTILVVQNDALVIVSVILGVVMYFVSHLIISKHLNLE